MKYTHDVLCKVPRASDFTVTLCMSNTFKHTLYTKTAVMPALFALILTNLSAQNTKSPLLVVLGETKEKD